MNRRIILIGGMPTAGKSTIAQAVAKHFGLPWISTDQIREIMKVAASPDSLPKLFSSTGYKAEEFLAKYSSDEIAMMEYEQGEEVWPGVKSVIHDWTWTKGCVIEGVNIIPKMVAADYKNEENVHAVFLSDTHHERLHNVVYSRGLFTAANNYSDDVKHLEVEWLKVFDQIIRDEAKKFGYPVINVNKDDSDLDKILRLVS